MKDAHRIPLLAILLIVVLRMSIGWQFLYEGLWKKNTLSGPNPWTSEGYLKTAQGPLRDYFRSMTGDPDDLNWLDYAAMSQRIYTFRDRFAAHYNLDDRQLADLNRLVDGDAGKDTDASVAPPVIVASSRQGNATTPSPELPADIVADLQRQAELDAQKDKLDNAGKQELAALQRKYRGLKLGSADARKWLTFAGPMIPTDETALLELVDVSAVPNSILQNEYFKTSALEEKVPADELQKNFYIAVTEVARNSRRLSTRHKLAAELRGDPDAVGVTWVINDEGVSGIVMATVPAAEESKQRNSVVYGKIQEYRDLVHDYNTALASAKMDYQNNHAAMLGVKLAGLRAELVPPIKALDTGLKSAAMELLRPDQLARGALPSSSPLTGPDTQVMWGLIILGILLISGLFSRIAAFLGAGLLLMFYMVQPPWPGLPPIPGPEHSFVVNKNLIECFALLAIAALPTGRWFGVDAILPRWGRKS